MTEERAEYLYDMIFKRKSFHLFLKTLKIESTEIDEINEYITQVSPLIKDIKTKIKIVPKNEYSCNKGEEMSIFLYSEKKKGYLQNIGYIGEQLDLFLASKNIGALWYGMGKPKENMQTYEGLDFVIMIAIAKVDEKSFRKDMFKSKRKDLKDVWKMKKLLSIGNIVRFSPSACNLQPWEVREDEKDICVYRYKNLKRRGIMPKNKVDFYNGIDIGIFMCFLEICLKRDKINYQRILELDDFVEDIEYTLMARYRLE